MIAFLAPGQGMERPGMGRDVADHWPEAAALLALAPGAVLHATSEVQPALTAVALGAAAALAAEGVRPDMVAGHSVGALAAWALAGGYVASDAVELARARGRAMEAVGAPGGLWVLDGDVPPGMVVAVENPGQTLIAGPSYVGVRVPTSGPWHSPAMRPAVPAFAAALAALPARPLDVPVVMDGRVCRADADVRGALVAQVAGPVRWTATLAALGALGVTDAVLLGPGKVLARHLALALPGVRVHRTDRAADVREAARALGG